MLRRIDNKTVIGQEVKIIVPDIHTVVYIEKSRRTQVEIEGGMEAGKINWLIYTGTLSDWDLKGKMQPMTIVERDLVLAQISDAMDLLDMPNRLV